MDEQIFKVLVTILKEMKKTNEKLSNIYTVDDVYRRIDDVYSTNDDIRNILSSIDLKLEGISGSLEGRSQYSSTGESHTGISQDSDYSSYLEEIKDELREIKFQENEKLDEIFHTLEDIRCNSLNDMESSLRNIDKILEFGVDDKLGAVKSDIEDICTGIKDINSNIEYEVGNKLESVKELLDDIKGTGVYYSINDVCDKLESVKDLLDDIKGSGVNYSINDICDKLESVEVAIDALDFD